MAVEIGAKGSFAFGTGGRWTGTGGHCSAFSTDFGGCAGTSGVDMRESGLGAGALAKGRRLVQGLEL